MVRLRRCPRVSLALARPWVRSSTILVSEAEVLTLCRLNDILGTGWRPLTGRKHGTSPTLRAGRSKARRAAVSLCVLLRLGPCLRSHVHRPTWHRPSLSHPSSASPAAVWRPSFNPKAKYPPETAAAAAAATPAAAPVAPTTAPVVPSSAEAEAGPTPAEAPVQPKPKVQIRKSSAPVAMLQLAAKRPREPDAARAPSEQPGPSHGGESEVLADLADSGEGGPSSGPPAKKKRKGGRERGARPPILSQTSQLRPAASVGSLC